MIFSSSPAFKALSVRLALIGATAFYLLTTSSHAEGEGAVLWEQEFSQLPTGPAPDEGKNLEIREENGLKFLSKLDSETQAVLSKKARGAAVIDYVFTVRFREPEKSTSTLLVKASGERPEVPYLWYYVSIQPGGISILCHGIPKGEYDDDPRCSATVSYEEMGASVLSPGEWITAHVAVGNEVIRVSVDAEDRQPRSAEFKVFPGTGGVGMGSRSPLDILSAVVRDAGETVVAKP